MEKIRKPKILIALARFPYPATDGTRRKILYNIGDALKKDFEVEYLVVSLASISKDDLKYFQDNYGKTHIFKISYLSFILRSIQHLFSSRPFQVSGFYVPRVHKWVKRNFSEYDVVFVHTVRMAEYFFDPIYIKNKKIIIDFNDAISLNYQKSKLYAHFPLNLVYSLEEARLRLYEKKVLDTFSNFNVISAHDKDYLLNLSNSEEYKKKILFNTIPYGIQPTFQYEIVDLPHNIYFIGQLDYEMNKTAVEFFLDNFWVELKILVPDIKFFIIGGGEKKLSEKYKHIEGLEFTGYISNSSPIIEKCVCLVAPILSGAGMPTKIIEAMANGIPVITSPQGAQGILGAKHNENIFILGEQDKHAWIQTIHKLMIVGVLNKSISINAKKLFEERYQLSKVQDMWLQFFTRVDESS